MQDLHQRILRTDVAGMPLEWIDYQLAVKLTFTGQISYTLGKPLFTIRGGINAQTGERSTITLNAIIATDGVHPDRNGHNPHYTPPLNNPALFRRDQNICLYCGGQFPDALLSRDHVTPRALGGTDTWKNVVTACVRCNHHKGCMTPEQAHMPLIAIPFTPTHAEYIYLQGRRILADQMAFLKSHFPRNSPIHSRFALAQTC